MNIILKLGIFGTLYMYLMFSFYNRSFNPMLFSQESVYWFGCSCLSFWIMGGLIKLMELDKPNK